MATRIALDSNNDPHLVFVDGTDLKYAYHHTTWEVSIVDNIVLQENEEIAIVVDAADRPHVVYLKWDGGLGYETLRHAVLEGTWNKSVVDDEENSIGMMSIAVGENLDPHIAYIIYDAGCECYKLKYATLNGVWYKEIIPGISRAHWPSIDLDSVDQPHISYLYHSGTEAFLRYVFEDGGWQSELVCSLGHSVVPTSLALDSNDAPHLSSYNDNEGALKYATKSGSWQIESVDTGIFEYSSIAVDGEGVPHIAYNDVASNSLKYAQRAGTWQAEIVDDVMVYSASLAVDSFGFPHIGYDGDGQCKYATVFTRTLTITASSGGSTDPQPGAYEYASGATAEVLAIPDPEYTLDYWLLDGFMWAPANPFQVDMSVDRTLHAEFVYTPVYDVTIAAQCNTLGEEVFVGIDQNGSTTGFDTPHTFTGLSGTHTFTVPDLDPHPHPFLEWNTHETSTTISVSSGGTYTAYYYEEPPSGVVSPGYIDFGTVTVGTAADSTFFITNVGDGILNGEVTIECDHYWILDGAGTFSLAHEDTHFVTVVFEPWLPGQHDCTIGTGLGTRSDVDCTGIGEEPPNCDIWPTELDFGEVLVGSYADSSFTITNSGGGFLTGTVDEPAGDFSITSGGGDYSLSAGQSKVVNVHFEPVVPGIHTSFVETGSSLCDDVSLSGISRLPVFDVAVIDVVRSDSLVAQSDTLLITVTLENQGDLRETFGVVAPFFDGDQVPASAEWYTFWSMGDIDRDGSIGTWDLDLLMAAFSSSPGDPNWNPDADLNEDLVVDVQDMMILAGNQGIDIWTHFGYPMPQSGTQRGLCLPPGDLDTLVFAWDTASVPPGDYVIGAFATHLADETDTLDNLFNDGTVTVFNPASGVSDGATPDGTVPLPTVFHLGKNRPNPFNPVTRIGFDLPRPESVRLTVFAVDGRKVDILTSGSYPAGSHEITWHARDALGRNVPSGVYFYRLEAGDFVQTKRMVLIR